MWGSSFSSERQTWAPTHVDVGLRLNSGKVFKWWSSASVIYGLQLLKRDFARSRAVGILGVNVNSVYIWY